MNKPPMGIDTAYDSLMSEFGQYTDPRRAPGQDIRISAMAESFIDLSHLLVVESSIKSILSHRLQRIGVVRPSQIANQFRQAIQMQMTELDGYPDDFISKEHYDPVLHEIFINDAVFSTLFFDCVVRNVATNKYQRYAGIKAAALLLPHRFGTHPRMLDVGCSQNQGYKAITENLLFEHVDIVDEHKHIDEHKTEIFNKILAQPINLGTSTGTDYWTIKTDPDIHRWARSCSFYPSELLIPELVKQYDTIESLEAPQLELVQSDFAMPGVRLHPDAPSQLQYDVSTAVTVLNQSNEVDDEQILENMERYTKPDGLQIIVDFARMEEGTPEEVHMLNRWYKPYTYHMTIKDLAEPELGHQDFITWETPRCKRAQLGAGKLALRAWERLEDVAQLI